LEKIGERVKIRKIAICGVLFSGKSTVCHILANLSTFVVSADDIVHDLLLTDSSTVTRVVKAFGNDVFYENAISRTKLAQIIFNDREKLSILESILHPSVKMEIERKYNIIKNETKYKAFVCEISIFDRVNMADWFDIVVAVTADPEMCKARSKQLGFTEEEFEKRLSFQQNQDEIIQLADQIIENNSSIDQLTKAVSRLIS